MSLPSKTLIRDARKHLKTAMSDTAIVLTTGIMVPCIIAVTTRAVPLTGAAEHIRVRKWRVLMPDQHDPLWMGTDVLAGYRLSSAGHGVFMVVEVTDPNTYNAATSVWCILTNAQVSFRRPGSSGATTSSVDVYIQRVSVEERKNGINFDWQVWFDATIQYPVGTFGGTLISEEDEMTWPRSPNPLPKGGHVVLDKPRYAYGENGSPLAFCYFKETA